MEHAILVIYLVDGAWDVWRKRKVRDSDWLVINHHTLWLNLLQIARPMHQIIEDYSNKNELELQEQCSAFFIYDINL